LAPAPSPRLNLLTLYGQPLPVQPVLAEQSLIQKPVLPPTPTKKDPNNLGVSTTAKSVFVADVASGGVLYAKAPHDVRSIASLTKLMTALVIMDSDKKLDGDLTFLPEDFDDESKPIVMAGDTITRRDALRVMLVGSINAAANALARTSGMTREDFIARMNRKAEELNLPSMVFVEPTGLSAGNKASAADVGAMLTIALRVPEIKEVLDNPVAIIKTKAGKEYKVDSTNLLLTSYLNKTPNKIIGAKTGSLPEAGYCMAQVTRNAEGHEVVAVLLDSDNHFSRYHDIKSLTGWAFDSFEWSN
jgi:D-alanyl-D-alanine endopeptidase (penicillin-binding protein 7)